MLTLSNELSNLLADPTIWEWATDEDPKGIATVGSQGADADAMLRAAAIGWDLAKTAKDGESIWYGIDDAEDILLVLAATEEAAIARVRSGQARSEIRLSGAIEEQAFCDAEHAADVLDFVKRTNPDNAILVAIPQDGTGRAVLNKAIADTGRTETAFWNVHGQTALVLFGEDVDDLLCDLLDAMGYEAA